MYLFIYYQTRTLGRFFDKIKYDHECLGWALSFPFVFFWGGKGVGGGLVYLCMYTCLRVLRFGLRDDLS